MKPIESTRTIAASLDLVFDTVSDIRNFCDAVPHITNIEFLSDQKTGAGTRFRETRLMGGRESTVDLEITELVENECVRMVSDAGGTIWDTLFTVKELASGAELQMAMDIRPYKLFSKVMSPMIRGMVVKGVESDMDSIKQYCEAKAR